MKLMECMWYQAWNSPLGIIGEALLYIDFVVKGAHNACVWFRQCEGDFP